MLADTFMSKYSLSDLQENEFSSLNSISEDDAFEVQHLELGDAGAVLEGLREDSATGPDMLPTRILRKISRVLALPVLLLVQSILATGRWPECWLVH